MESREKSKITYQTGKKVHTSGTHRHIKLNAFLNKFSTRKAGKGRMV